MKPGFPLRWAFAIVFFYAFVTVLFLDDKHREETTAPPHLAAESPATSAPDVLLPARD